MNNPVWLTALGFYTLIIIGGIYYYENKITLLQKQVKDLKLENAEMKATAWDWQRAYNLSQPIQYESTGYISNQASTYKDVDTIIEL